MKIDFSQYNGYNCLLHMRPDPDHMQKIISHDLNHFIIWWCFFFFFFSFFFFFEAIMKIFSLYATRFCDSLTKRICLSAFHTYSHISLKLHKYIYIYIHILSNWVDRIESLDSLSLSLSLAILSYHPPLLAGPLNPTQCPHRTDLCTYLLVCQH